MAKKQLTQPDYYNILPPALQQQADALVDYLTYFPFEKPACCYYCGSKYFYANSTTKYGIDYYYCLTCRKGFNQLTGTPLIRTSYPDKWGSFAYWRLSGLSLEKVAEKSGLSKGAAVARDKKFLIMMQKQASELYQWWISHQTREDITMTSLVRKQRNILKQWLHKMIHQKTATCPNCHKECTRLINDRANPDRPQFICNHCRKSVNPLAKTPFHGMHFIHLWLPYIDLITEGISHAEIEQRLGVSKRALTLWHKNLLKQIDIMQLDGLKQWMAWQKSRYQVEANSKSNKTK